MTRTLQTTAGETANDEAALWRNWLACPHQTHAYHRLVEHYLPLVAQIVERQSFRVRSRMQKEELLSAGVVGLHQAVRSFRAGRGVEFGAFARKRIHGAIVDELRQRDHLTRVQRHSYRGLCAVIRTLSIDLKRAPTNDEIAAAADLSVEDVRQTLALGQEAVSIDMDSEEGVPYLERLADDNAVCPRAAADRAIARDLLRDALRQLDERDQQLLFMRHIEGLRGKEIATVLGLSEGRISQCYQEIIGKLRALMDVDAGR